jgi:uncharacterized protein
MSEDREKKKRGFAALSPERRREISSLGGIKAHEAGKGHEFTSEEAKAAGAKGGAALRTKRAKEPEGQANGS